MATTTNLGLTVDQAGSTKFYSSTPTDQTFVKTLDDNLRLIDQFAGDIQPITVTNVSPVFAADSTYNEYGYKGTIPVLGATASMRPEVVFAMAQAVSGDYAPICESGTDCVYIYAKVNTAITIPSVTVYKE